MFLEVFSVISFLGGIIACLRHRIVNFFYIANYILFFGGFGAVKDLIYSLK